MSTVAELSKELAGLTAALQKAGLAGDVNTMVSLAARVGLPRDDSKKQAPTGLHLQIERATIAEQQAAVQAKASDALAALKALDGKFILAFQAGIKSINITPRLEGDVMTVVYAINSKAGPKSNGGTGTKRPRIQYSIDGGNSTYRAGFIDAAAALGSTTAKALIELPHGKGATDTERTNYANECASKVDSIQAEVTALGHTVTIA